MFCGFEFENDSYAGDPWPQRSVCDADTNPSGSPPGTMPSPLPGT